MTRQNSNNDIAKMHHNNQTLILKTEVQRCEIQDLKTQIEALNAIIHSNKEMLNRAQKDLIILGEKLTDEIEERAELQHSKHQLEEELEQLTQSLFEEANNMVANEARQRFEQQEKVL